MGADSNPDPKPGPALAQDTATLQTGWGHHQVQNHQQHRDSSPRWLMSPVEVTPGTSPGWSSDTVALVHPCRERPQITKQTCLCNGSSRIYIQPVSGSRRDRDGALSLGRSLIGSNWREQEKSGLMSSRAPLQPQWMLLQVPMSSWDHAKPQLVLGGDPSNGHTAPHCWDPGIKPIATTGSTKIHQTSAPMPTSILPVGWPWGRCVGPTCTLGAADEGWARFASAPLAGPGEQDADLVLRVGVQVPQLVGLHVDSMDLRPGPRGHAVLDLLAHDGAVADDGVGVELDDEVGGTGPEQLGGRDGCGGLWKREGAGGESPSRSSSTVSPALAQANSGTTRDTTILFDFPLATVEIFTTSLPRRTQIFSLQSMGTKLDPLPREHGDGHENMGGHPSAHVRAPPSLLVRL